MEKHNIKIGATVKFDIRRVSNNTPVDLTGWEIESFLKHPKFGRIELEVTEVNLPDGHIRLTLDEDTSASLVPAEYVWDIKYTKPDGDVEIFPKDNTVIFNFIRGAS